MKFYLKVIIFIFFLIISEKLFASVTVDSVSVQTSTCTNNGVAQVFARSNPPGTLLYAITAGPILAPIQNSNVFSSLYPGSYNLRVYNVNFDSTDYQFQISGNYQLPEFTLRGVDPTCPGFTDGSINVVLDSSKGLAPFSYEIISPITTPPQTTGFFPNLSSNTYFVRVTDACGNYQTRTEVLFNSGTALAINTFIIPSVAKIGCDTMLISTGIYLYKEKWTQPLQVTYNTPFGPITKIANLQVLDTFYSNPGYFVVVDTIVGLDYNDYLNIVFTDVCGVTVSSMMNQIAPFEFDFVFQPATVNCVATYSAYAQLRSYPNYPYDYTYANAPLSFVLTDVNTGLVVDSGTCYSDYCSVSLKPQAPGVLYNMVVTDGCGDVWQSNVMWPTAGTPTVAVYTSPGCLDSTTVLTFGCFDFQSIPRVTILSGPSFASSTKPFYAYNEAISYPQTFVAAASVNTIYVKDFPVGTYNYIVQDSCGNSVTGTFTVEDYMVANLSFSWSVKPSCLNNNTFYYNFVEGTGGALSASIIDIATNQVVATPVLNYLGDSITTFPIGNYALEIYYLNRQGFGGQYFDGGLVNSGISCWVVRDTIVISPYTNNFFITNTTVYCNGNYYVALEVDSTRGVAPYKFAIISGPQTFPLQDSAFFQISTFGNYLISMEDVCGNNYTQQISVTSDSFPPIVRGGYFCEGNFASLSASSSPYFTNIWKYPNGNLFVGDSISFQPFSLADTGLYNVTTLVNINGCTDSLKSSFYLSGKDSVILNLKICPGDSVSVGPKYYSLPGTYRDTLSTVLGCDSVLITNLSYKVTQVDSNRVSICFGDSVSVGNNFYSIPGVYLDTVSVPGNCKKLVVTQLTVNNYLDSISATICQGDTFRIGNSKHFLAGMYKDTLTSANGCDSVIILSLSFTPFLVDSNLVSICNGDSLSVGSNVYATSGIYIDTIPDLGNCKKIVVTQLNVISSIDSISAQICQGDSFMVGNIVHSSAGIFTDTLTAASGCDSLVVVNLSLSPLTVDSNVTSICFGDSLAVGLSYYSTSGVYKDTVDVPGSCKKIVVTQLSVISYVDSVSATICLGDSVVIGNNSYSSAGTFTDSLTSVSGCDSLVIINIAYSQLLIDSNSVTICAGDSILVGTNYYYQTGTYLDTVAVSGNCKKILITQLTVNSIIDSVNAVICQGDSFYVGNVAYTSQGIYKDTLVTSAGCDSVIILNLSFSNLIVDSNAITICSGDSISVGSNYYYQTGTFVDTVTVSGNCKKILITQLTVNSIIDSVNAVICQGDSFFVGNVAYTSPGIYKDTLVTSAGCDSVIILDLSFSNLIVDTNVITICSGDSIVVGTNYYYQTGSYVDTVTVSGNCKKILITQLTVNSIIDSVNAVICQGDSFLVGSVAYTSPGIYKDTLVTSAGCDSVIILDLSFSNLIVDTNEITICSGDSITVGMNSYYQTGLYVDTVIVSGNCKKVVVTQLSVNTISNSINAVICQGESFIVGTNVYETTGVYSDTLVSVVGCDSVVVLNLLVINGGSSTSSYTICFGDSVLFGNSYLSTTGLYADTINAGNCDSLVYLQLSILPPLPVSITANTTIATAGVPILLSSIDDPMWNYLWSGNGVFENPSSSLTNVLIDTTSWIYLSVTNSSGCIVTDSILLYIENDKPEDSCDFSTVFIPNAFSPNNDGINDFFEVASTNVMIKNFIIFNRWGQLIFESSGSEKRWNGYFINEPAPSGVYVYLVEYLNCVDNKKRYRYGNITLLD